MGKNLLMPESVRSKTMGTIKARLAHLTPNVCLIRLEGELDRTVLKDLVRFTDANLLVVETAVIIDMSELSYMDSSGIKFIYGLGSRFGYENIAAYGIGDDLRRILDVVGLADKISYLYKPEETAQWRQARRRAA